MWVIVNYLSSGQAAEEAVAGIEAAGGIDVLVHSALIPCAIRPFADMTTPALGTSKAAMAQFARFLAQELGHQGTTVNVVEAGPVTDTAISHVMDGSVCDSG
jgi:NAD(P)-dependent dehydrogenase (short-subunit alcohol dehydrogenase family)